MEQTQLSERMKIKELLHEAVEKQKRSNRAVELAASRGQLDEAMKVVDSTTEDARTRALFLAVKGQHKGVVRLLLEHGTDVNRKDDAGGGWTCLMIAAEKGSENLEIVKLLVQHGADVSLKDGAGRNALEISELDSRRRVDELLGTRSRRELRLRIENARQFEKLLKKAPFNLALSQGQWDSVKELAKLQLAEGGTDEGRTRALFFAVRKEREDLVRVLLEHGADVNFRDSDGRSCLMTAVQGGNVKVTELLVEHVNNVKGSGEYSAGYFVSEK